MHGGLGHYTARLVHMDWQSVQGKDWLKCFYANACHWRERGINGNTDGRSYRCR